MITPLITTHSPLPPPTPAVLRRVPAGGVLLTQGEPAQSMFVVSTGEASLVKLLDLKHPPHTPGCVGDKGAKSLSMMRGSRKLMDAAKEQLDTGEGL